MDVHGFRAELGVQSGHSPCGQPVEIPAYVIHIVPDPESYFFYSSLKGSLNAPGQLPGQTPAKQGIFGWLRDLWNKSDARQLEEAINETQTKIDAALTALEVKLHPELYDHAWRGQKPGPSDGLDRDAWPLPASVPRRPRLTPLRAQMRPVTGEPISTSF